MTLKPNTQYWFSCRNGERYVEGETVLHEGIPVDKNYNSMVITDAEGKVETFRPHGETFHLKEK